MKFNLKNTFGNLPCAITF